MNIVFSRDVILCGWLSSKYLLTNWLTSVHFVPLESGVNLFKQFWSESGLNSFKRFCCHVVERYCYYLQWREQDCCLVGWFLWQIVSDRKIWNRVDCLRSEKRSKTHKRLKECFLIGQNWTKRANFWCNHLFQATYDTTENS